MSGQMKKFTRSNGKVRQLGCPYGSDLEVIELTATEYGWARRCQCSYCWANTTRYRWVEQAVWEVDDE